MEKIENVWFEGGCIYIKTNKQHTLSRPLEAFPTLLDADEKERYAYRIGRFGDDIRWEMLDEDLHISSFYDTKEPNPDNEVGRIFRTYPQLSVVGMANYLGIHKSLLDRYIYGMVEPSPQRMLQIKEALHAVGRQLIEGGQTMPSALPG